MKIKFTRLACILIAFLWINEPAMGQFTDDMLKLSLRIGESTVDSMTCFYASGELAWSTTATWDEPDCRIAVDDESKPSEFLVTISRANSHSGLVTYAYDATTTEATYEGTKLSSLTYRISNHSDGWNIGKNNYAYNEIGQITLIETWV